MRALVEEIEVRGLKVTSNRTSEVAKELAETENPDMGLLPDNKYTIKYFYLERVGRRVRFDIDD